MLDVVGLFGLVLDGDGDHVGGQVDAAHRRAVRRRHVEGRAADAAADVQHLHARLQVQVFRAEFLRTVKEPI